MRCIRFAGRKVFWACIKDLGQHCWYAFTVSLFVTASFWGLIATVILGMMQGVGPSIAISFTVYEALRSSWRTQR